MPDLHALPRQPLRCQPPPARFRAKEKPRRDAVVIRKGSSPSQPLGSSSRSLATHAAAGRAPSKPSPAPPPVPARRASVYRKHCRCAVEAAQSVGRQAADGAAAGGGGGGRPGARPRTTGVEDWQLGVRMREEGGGDGAAYARASDDLRAERGEVCTRVVEQMMMMRGRGGGGVMRRAGAEAEGRSVAVAAGGRVVRVRLVVGDACLARRTRAG